MSDTYDLIIIGAGPAGIAAGVAAKNCGLKTLIVHADSEIGGQATNIYVGTICGIHNRFNGRDDIVGNFSREFCRQLANKSKTSVVTNKMGLSYLPYQREAFLALSNEMLNGKNIQLKHNTKVTKVLREQDSINSIEITKKGSTFKVQASNYIDCSGNGIISILAEAELIEEEQYQYGSIVVGLKGIKETDEQVLKLSLYKELEEAYRSNKIKLGGKSLSLVTGTANTYPDTTYLKFNSLNNELTYEEEMTLLNEILNHLKTKTSFKNIAIHFLSKSRGVRSSIRPIGKTILSDQAVLNSEKSQGSIARGIWPVELWKGEKPPLIEHLKDDSYYDIPYTCLQSKGFSNLLSAGRALSSEEKAHSSARVIGTALQTGHAAGFLAGRMTEGQDIKEAVKKYQSLEGLE